MIRHLDHRDLQSQRSGQHKQHEHGTHVERISPLPPNIPMARTTARSREPCKRRWSNLRLVVEMIGGNGSVIYQGDGASGALGEKYRPGISGTTLIAVPSLSINASPASIANGAQSTMNWLAVQHFARFRDQASPRARCRVRNHGRPFGNAPYLLTCQTNGVQTFTASTTVAVALRTSMPVLPDTTNLHRLGEQFNDNVANWNTDTGMISYGRR